MYSTVEFNDAPAPDVTIRKAMYQLANFTEFHLYKEKVCRLALVKPVLITKEHGSGLVKGAV